MPTEQDSPQQMLRMLLLTSSINPLLISLEEHGLKKDNDLAIWMPTTREFLKVMLLTLQSDGKPPLWPTQQEDFVRKMLPVLPSWMLLVSETLPSMRLLMLDGSRDCLFLIQQLVFVLMRERD
jgi:hypothetical protein